MRIGSWLALAGREFRGSTGRLVFFAACLSVGVAAVVAVDGFATALDSSIQGQARELLAADIAISSRRPISEEIFAAIESLPEAQTAKVRQLLSVVSVPIGNGDIDRPGPSLLCEIKAVEAGYPFYGLLDTQPVLPQAKILKGDRVLVGPELLARLDLSVGDTLRIGRVGHHRRDHCRGTRPHGRLLSLRPARTDVGGDSRKEQPYRNREPCQIRASGPSR